MLEENLQKPRNRDDGTSTTEPGESKDEQIGVSIYLLIVHQHGNALSKDRKIRKRKSRHLDTETNFHDRMSFTWKSSLSL
jgi:hypothetical protein